MLPGQRPRRAVAPRWYQDPADDGRHPLVAGCVSARAAAPVPMDSVRATPTPMLLKTRLDTLSTAPSQKKLDALKNVPYRQVVGSLLYDTPVTRPGHQPRGATLHNAKESRVGPTATSPSKRMIALWQSSPKHTVADLLEHRMGSLVTLTVEHTAKPHRPGPFGPRRLLFLFLAKKSRHAERACTSHLRVQPVADCTRPHRPFLRRSSLRSKALFIKSAAFKSVGT